MSIYNFIFFFFKIDFLNRYMIYNRKNSVILIMNFSFRNENYMIYNTKNIDKTKYVNIFNNGIITCLENNIKKTYFNKCFIISMFHAFSFIPDFKHKLPNLKRELFQLLCPISKSNIFIDANFNISEGFKLLSSKMQRKVTKILTYNKNYKYDLSKKEDFEKFIFGKNNNITLEKYDKIISNINTTNVHANFLNYDLLIACYINWKIVNFLTKYKIKLTILNENLSRKVISDDVKPKYSIFILFKNGNHYEAMIPAKQFNIIPKFNKHHLPPKKNKKISIDNDDVKEQFLDDDYNSDLQKALKESFKMEKKNKKVSIDNDDDVKEQFSDDNYDPDLQKALKESIKQQMQSDHDLDMAIKESIKHQIQSDHDLAKKLQYE